MNSFSSGFHPFPHLLTFRDVAHPHRQEPGKEPITGTCWGYLRVFEPPLNNKVLSAQQLSRSKATFARPADIDVGRKRENVQNPLKCRGRRSLTLIACPPRE